MPTRAYAAASATSSMAPFSLERRVPQPTDVVIDILYCGVCHSDLHTVRNEWGGSVYPCVPGHEIVGKVAAVGAKVAKFKVGDHAAVGCMVDSCRSCGECQRGLEQYCAKNPTWTYGSPDRHTGGHTFGGYSERIVVDEAFVLKVSEKANLAATAPLLCAGITTYSPLRQWQVGPGQRVGIVGLGGLGHMGVKLARALGAEVFLFTTSPGKKVDAARLGAHHAVVSTHKDEMKPLVRSLDFILDTVSGEHDLNVYLNLLKVDGTLCLVGLPEKPVAIKPFSLVGGRKRLAGSGIGSIAETQEMLDFCAEKGIVSDIEMIAMKDINAAYERLLKGDVKYRFVIDLATLK